MVHEKVALNGHNPVSVLPFPNRHQGTKKKKNLLHWKEWKDMENIQKKMNLRTSPILDY